MTPPPASVHASAVCVGEQAILIRGASGTGKSRLVLDLILAGRAGIIAATKLIGDDRVRLDTRNGRVSVSGVPELEGMLEIRGLGIRRCDFTAAADIALVVDLAASDAERLPPPERLKTLISGVELPRIPVAAGKNPLPLVLGFLTTN
jgi:HPr kinase/phosphorylase